MTHGRRKRQSSRYPFIFWPRLLVSVAGATVFSVAVAGCAAQSIDTVTALINAARVGDTAAIEHVTREEFPQEDLAVIATYALEGCEWTTGDASTDEVHGTFICPPGGSVESDELVFTLKRSKVSAVSRSTE